MERKFVAFINILFLSLHLFSQPYVTFHKGCKWGLKDSTGKIILKPKYSNLYALTDKFFMETDCDKTFIINDSLFDFEKYPENIWRRIKFDDGTAQLLKNTHFTIIDYKGKKLTPFYFDEPIGFYENKFIGKQKNKYFIITTSKKINGPFDYIIDLKQTDTSKIFFGSLTHNGGLSIKLNYKDSVQIYDGQWEYGYTSEPVLIDGNFGLVNTAGNKVLDSADRVVLFRGRLYDLLYLMAPVDVSDSISIKKNVLKTYTSEFVMTRKKDRWGIVNAISGKTIIPFENDTIETIEYDTRRNEPNLFISKKQNQSQLFSNTGKVLATSFDSVGYFYFQVLDRKNDATLRAEIIYYIKNKQYFFSDISGNSSPFINAWVKDSTLVVWQNEEDNSPIQKINILSQAKDSNLIIQLMWQNGNNRNIINCPFTLDFSKFRVLSSASYMLTFNEGKVIDPEGMVIVQTLHTNCFGNEETKVEIGFFDDGHTVLKHNGKGYYFNPVY